jgi:hypothetical protein
VFSRSIGRPTFHERRKNEEPLVYAVRQKFYKVLKMYNIDLKRKTII